MVLESFFVELVGAGFLFRFDVRKELFLSIVSEGEGGVGYPVVCGVEVWRGGLGGAYRLPTLSSVGASLVPPCFRFHTPLIEPDVRICRIRLSEKTHAIAIAIACDAVCNFWKQLGSCQAHRQSPFPSSLRVSAFN
jgi:hypothetical protein